MPREITSIILAGGKNLRLGRNKAFEIIRGKTIIDRVFERLEPISSQIVVVTSWAQFDIELNLDADIIADIYPNMGPLGGIYTGLTASKSDVNIIAACDMPFLNTNLLEYMSEILAEYDAVVPRLANEMIEPLHAVYAKNCLSRIDERLAARKLSIHAFLDEVNVRYLEEVESRNIDPELTSFFNINYQTDLDKALKIAEEYGI
ncbi:MAG: molybdenum cofactor guanylyltransferase [Dehalococcoidales bacterium]|nr:MAG: molybdenum cofactor guanylyltransferase [Dehalococcoidales bacterium]